MNWHRLLYLTVVVCVCTVMALTMTGYRTVRLYSTVADVSSQVKYLIENGGTIGQVPAEDALSSSYLEIIFGDDPELLSQLKQAVEKGLKEYPEVNEGEVAAIIITYRKNGDDRIENVVANIIGGFPLGRRNISMHKNGFFAEQLDGNLWNTGDSILRFLGRDLIVWANNEDDARSQKELRESILTGEVMLLAESITEKPLYYTAVLPAPKQLLPPKMRQHVRAVLVNGSLSPERGTFDLVVLTDNERSASMVSSILFDLRTSMLIGLRTRFGGVEEETAWGPHIPVWWAYEMGNTIEDMQLTKRDHTVRFQSQYDRRMVNVTLKTIERFGRDYSQIKGVQEDKLDPRVVDAAMQTRKPNHYWSEAHRWGPDWPIPAPNEVNVQRPGEGSPMLDTVPPTSPDI